MPKVTIVTRGAGDQGDQGRLYNRGENAGKIAQGVSSFQTITTLFPNFPYIVIS